MSYQKPGAPQTLPALRSRRSTMIAGALTGLGVSISTTPAHAAATWHMVTEYPQTNISGVGLQTFAKAVATRTNGFVTTVDAFDAESKVSSGEMFRAAQEQRISGGDAFAGPLESSNAVFGVASLPFVAQSVEGARLLSRKARPFFESALDARGLKLLYITVWPPTGLWSDRPLKTPDDIRALAVRTYDYNSADLFKSLGATAQYLPFNEGILQVKARKLNAILSSGDGGAGRKLWIDLPYFTAINYAIPISIAFVRRAEFDVLTPRMRKSVDAAAVETEAAQSQLLATRTAENYAQMRANGVVIDAVPAPEVMAALRAAAQGPIDAWKAKVGPEVASLVTLAQRQ